MKQTSGATPKEVNMRFIGLIEAIAGGALAGFFAILIMTSLAIAVG